MTGCAIPTVSWSAYRTNDATAILEEFMSITRLFFEGLSRLEEKRRALLDAKSVNQCPKRTDLSLGQLLIPAITVIAGATSVIKLITSLLYLHKQN
jgi:hypothetical protein